MHATADAVPFLPAGGPVGLRVPDALDARGCAALVDAIERRGFDATGASYPADYRDNDRQVFDDDALAGALFAALGDRLPRELREDGHAWELVGLNRRFRACRYRGGQAFCIHRDGAHVASDELRSWLTLQIYLDDGDGFTGGHTRFYADRTGVDVLASIGPALGTAIVFDHRAWHDGEAVTGGTKRVLRTDVMYRRGAPIAASAAAGRVPRDVLGHHRGYVWQVIARRDGTLASAGRDGHVRVWRETPEVHAVAGSSVTALCEAADDRLWCGTRGGELVVIDGDGPHRIADDLGAVLGLAPFEDGVAVASARGEVIAFDARGARRWTTAAHLGWAWAIVAAPDGLRTCGDDGRVVAIDRRGEPRTLAVLDRRLRALARAAPGELLVGDADGGVTRLAADGAPIDRLRAHDAIVTALAIGPDGTWASASEDDRVRCWRGTEPIASWTAADFVTTVAFTARGALAGAGYDGAVWLVEPPRQPPR
ncbi:MAG: 2OG-Fe(II) oxygenase [Deltaproteobacteria bacterium]|nr:2OG-Fe(II) oxygenase [Deltaproteobacteria bacterium]